MGYVSYKCRQHLSGVVCVFLDKVNSMVSYVVFRVLMELGNKLLFFPCLFN